jgi:tetratricopeptide (TPR) repeat protein
MDIFDAYKNDCTNGEFAAIFLLGDCFQNSLVLDKFHKLIQNEKLFLFTNKEIHNILPVYPKIDFQRYIDHEARIKAQAQAEEQKKAEQRAFEDKLKKEKEAEEKRIAANKKAEQNRKEAQKLYERAVELDGEGKLQDALVNIENAVALDSDNSEYKRLAGIIKNKLDELKIKTEQYKALLNKAEKSLQEGKFESALNIYELIKDIFDSVEIKDKILEIKEKIEENRIREEENRIREEEKKQQAEKIKAQEDAFDEFVFEATLAEKKGNRSKALAFLEEALKIKPGDAKVKARIKTIKFDLEFEENKTSCKEDDFLKTTVKKTETKTIFCTKCGAKLSANDRFCFLCGKVIDNK